MFGLSVLQDRWLLLALVGGLVLVAAFVLLYLAFWRQRVEARGDWQPSEEPAPPRGLAWLRSFLPWFIILELVGLSLFTIIYIVIMIVHPPDTW